MKRRGIQLSNRHRRWLYTVSTVLFVSGLAWVIFAWRADRDQAHAEFLRSFNPWMLKLHGAAAMAFLVAIGILIPTHIRRGWQARRNHLNGSFFLAVIGLLVITGYGLYYLGDEQWRDSASWFHIILGLASPALLIWHIWLGRRSAQQN